MAMSQLESQSTEVALDMMPSEKSVDNDKRSLDFITILTIVVTVLQQVIQNCPQSTATLVLSAKKPSRMQAAYLLKECRDACDCCGNPMTRRMAGAMADSIRARAAKMNDAELGQLIVEARNFDNLLI